MHANTLNSSIQLETLTQAQQIVQNVLTDAAHQPTQLTRMMSQVFGSNLDEGKVETLVKQWSQGEFGTLPIVEILSQKVMGTAQGAYATNTNTIYLSARLLRDAGQTDDLTGVAGVLLEEMGHSLDALLNRSDTPGDEGELFAALIQGRDLSPIGLQVLKNEDDSATLQLGSQSIDIEMSQISMTKFKGKLFQMHRGQNDGMYVRSSSDGTNWGTWKEIGGTTPNAPSIAAFQGKLYATYRGMDNNVYTSSSTDGVTWSIPEKAPGETSDGLAKTSDAPTIATANDRLYEAHRGLANGIYIRSSTDGTNWTTWEKLDGETRDAIALTSFKNKLYVSHRGLDNGIYTRSYKGGKWSPWEKAPGGTPDAPVLGASKTQLYQMHRGSDNEIYMRSSVDGSIWSAWQKQGGATLSAPFVTTFQGKLYQTHQGIDDQIFTRFLDSSTWTNWVDGGGSTPVDRDSRIEEPVDVSTQWSTTVFTLSGAGAPPTNFYENRHLRLGQINLGSNIRDDGRKGISFDLGAGSLNSDSRLPSDSFAVRAYTSTYFNGGSYKFNAQGDDGFQILAKNQATGQWFHITPENQWQQAYGNSAEYKFALPAGQYDLHYHFYEEGGNASFDLAWEKDALIEETVDVSKDWNATVFSWSGQGTPPANFYENNDARLGAINLGSNTRGDGRKGTSFDLGSGSLNGNSHLPNDSFAVRAYTSAYFDGSSYNFNVRGDDGFQILAKNQATGQWFHITPENQWQQAYGNSAEYKFALPAGQYDLHYHFYEEGGNASFDLAWEKEAPITPPPIVWEKPLDSGYRVSSEYGRRFLNGTWENHTGIDLATGQGNTPPVEAARGGRIISAGWNTGGYGNLVKIDHGDGLQTWYAHLSEITVQVGDIVTDDTIIGKVGSTGNSTGNHLHFEVRKNGIPSNPREYLPSL